MWYGKIYRPSPDLTTLPDVLVLFYGSPSTFTSKQKKEIYMPWSWSSLAVDMPICAARTHSCKSKKREWTAIMKFQKENVLDIDIVFQAPSRKKLSSFIMWNWLILCSPHERQPKKNPLATASQKSQLIRSGIGAVESGYQLLSKTSTRILYSQLTRVGTYQGPQNSHTRWHAVVPFSWPVLIFQSRVSLSHLHNAICLFRTCNCNV